MKVHLIYANVTYEDILLKVMLSSFFNKLTPRPRIDHKFGYQLILSFRNMLMVSFSLNGER